MKKTTFNPQNVSKPETTLSLRNSKAAKWKYTLLLLFIPMVSLFAQNSGQINTQLTTWAGNIKTTLNIVVGIFAIVGGFMVFLQYMQGNEQAQRNFIRFVIGLAIFGLVTLIANVFLPSGAITTTN